LLFNAGCNKQVFSPIKLVQIRLVLFEKNIPLILKNDVTEPKARMLGYSNYQLKSC